MSDLSGKEKSKRKYVINKLIGYILITIQIILTCIFFSMLFHVNILPDRYMIILVVSLILITVYNIISQFTKAHIIGKGFSIFLSVVMLTGFFTLDKALDMFRSITGHTIKNDSIAVFVLESDPAETIGNAKDYSFGYHDTADFSNIEKTISDINERLSSQIKTSAYPDWTLLIKALYNQNVEAIILNEAYVSTLTVQFTDFEEKTKVLDIVNIETRVQMDPVHTDINSEPFSIYISGNDEYEGDILTASSRSDVNIVATFHPKTRQVILVSTPRDYYMNVETLKDAGTITDKLTHAGNFGIDASVATLSNFYGVDINYYVNLNFTGLINLIDALGGITVDSEIAFTTTPDTSPVPYRFVAGPNDCNGEKALAFCRERMAFSSGDNQRGINQMTLIKALIEKASSPAFLQNYSGIMDSLSGLLATNMSQNTMTSFIKEMINDRTPWNVQSYHVDGTNSSANSSYFGLVGMSVILPDYHTVNIAIEMINKIQNGEIFDAEQFIESRSLENSE